MSWKKLSLLGLFVFSFFTIPTGCKKERPPKVDGIEQTTSPSQLGDWMAQLLAIIRATDLTGAQTSRIMAYASIAYYEGYQLSAEDMRSLVGQLDGLDALPTPSPDLSYNYGVIAEAAMETVLLHMFADAPQNIKLVISSTYVEHERDYLNIGVVEPVVARSRALGQLMGNAINNWADNDGYAQMIANCDVTVPTGGSDWKPTPSGFSPPEYPCWGDLRAFTFSPDQLISLCHPGIPIEVSNDGQYAVDIEEIGQLESNLNDAQKDMANFWSDGPGTYTVPGHYISILRQLIGQNLLDGKETVTAFTHLCIAMADTYISTYKLKYTYWRPRPLTVIREGGDSNWESYVINPSTPEYPSLRTTMAYAATQVFINRYGDIEFTDKTHEILNLDARVYASFTEMGHEAVYSRLYAGTNLRTTAENSEYHGRCIAQRANELFFNQ
ncbi:MAG: phosphatase PAP2 family protein [Flavobacteriales bacterium]|nr:phosphatase PAP2 family protein [Flavobacteriales bacterium]